MKYSVQQVAEFTHGELHASNDLDRVIQRVYFDSRRINKPLNALFVALKTDQNDGHKYILDAYDRGVRSFLVSQLPAKKLEDASFILVENTLDALQKLATEHRRNFEGPLIAITGSNGKTIVKEWAATLLTGHGKVHKTPSSYNSQIGVALSLLGLRPDHQVGVFEAGISQPGEMAALREMLEPTIGLITNIGQAHSENFPNQQEKLKEKLSLFDGCPVLIYEADNPLIVQGIQDYPWEVRPRLLGWSRTESDFLIWTDELAELVPYKDAARQEDAAHATAIATALGFHLDKLKGELSKLPEVQMRVQLTRGRNSSTLINDFYNSDWESIENALSFLNEQKQNPRKSIILTDLVENSHDEGLYRRLAQRLKDFNPHQLIVLGPQWKQFMDELPDGAHWFDSTGSLLAELNTFDFQNVALLLKGARQYALERVARRLSFREHPTVLEIRTHLLTHNLRYFRQRIHKGTQLMAMVKAFSYGTGTFEIANILRYHHVDYLAVAYPDEGVHLRRQGIDLPILVLNSEQRNFEVIIEHQLEPEIYSLGHLQRFVLQAEMLGVKGYPIQLKIETGMHRLGLTEEDLEDAIRIIQDSTSVQVKAAFTHLAAADDPQERPFSLEQIARFERSTRLLEDRLGYSFLKHVLNSSGISNFPEAQFDLVRLGIGLYGVSNDPSEQKHLRLVGRWVSEVAQIKHVKAGETVGYGRAFTAENDTRIATVSLGYADGLSRRLGEGVGKLYWKDRDFPIAGRVCMDMCMLDIGDAPIQEGDEIVVFERPDQLLDLARALGTIPYEVLTSISTRVRRVYLQE